MSLQSLLNAFRANRYQEVISSIDFDSFSALENPVITNIVAASYFKMGEFSKSLNLLSQIESCFVDDVDYLSLYGACLRRNGDLELARLQFERALKISPDSLSIQNNFANLLIDLGDFAFAEKILIHILSVDESYEDAKVNKLRLSERLRITKSLPSSNNSSADSLVLGDPLLLAFTSDESRRTLPVNHSTKQANQVKSIISDSLPSFSEQQVASDQFKLAQQAIKDKRYNFALKLCSQAKTSMQELSGIYECVSDAYIAQSLFREAEICILHAIQLGVSGFKLYVNLVSIACMRNDYDLAQFYFEKLLTIDPEHILLPQLRVQIAKCKKLNQDSPFRFDQPWSTPPEAI